MKTYTISRAHRRAATAVATALAVVGLAVAAPASAAGNNACPGLNAIDNFVTASNVGAAFENTGSTTEYTFVSLVNENPVNGVPGLAAYCVYTDPAPTSVAIDPSVVGFNGAGWVVSGKFSKNFAFLRPGGAKSDIPLEGQTITMGTATWAADAPATQVILLHIDDPAVCSALYGTALTTCFVKPTEVSLRPVCDLGPPNLTNVAYTSIPRDAVDCGPPSWAFEAQQTAEFGDAVGLASTAKDLQSLTVLFNSYGCSDSGHWYDGTCQTTPGTFFTHSITATIYALGAGNTVGLPLAQVTAPFNIFFRPTADPACTGTALGGWFNAASNQCEFSAKQLLTFNFPAGITLPTNVIWTVAFNTSHYGYLPIGEDPACFGINGGCGYDSLNVGTKSYTNAPFKGTDLVEDEAWLAKAPSPVIPLGPFTGFTGNRPLGQINLAP